MRRSLARWKKHLGCESGMTLLMVLMAAVCISVLIAVGYSILHGSIKRTRTELTLKGQTFNIAASGITEALTWFRGQRVQPVRVFNPQTLLGAAPGESGLARDYEVSASGSLWGHYVVAPERVEDISLERGRGKTGDGLVWRVRSEGVLYLRRDPKKPYHQSPNEVVNRMLLQSEFQRININPPVASAILSENGKKIEILEGGRVRGLSGAALTFRHGTGRPTISVPYEVTSGSSSRVNPAPEKIFNLDVRSVFGVSWRELREVSDILVDSLQVLPAELPRMGIVFIDGDATFDRKRPLNGGGVLIVNGRLQIASNSNSTFAGLIYCRGDFSMDAPAVITGSVIALGAVRLQGFGDFAEVQYDANLLSSIKQRLGQYRQTQAMLQVRE